MESHCLLSKTFNWFLRAKPICNVPAKSFIIYIYIYIYIDIFVFVGAQGHWHVITIMYLPLTLDARLK